MQETYLHARAGYAGYRGDNDRAWLHTIARNTFFSHIRRAYVRSEVPLHEDLYCGDTRDAGSMGHINWLDIDRSLTELPSALQSALVMKYVDGHTFSEIAEHSNVCVRTAKSRVEKAARLIREAFGEGGDLETKCAEMTTSRFLDYLYRLLPPGRHSTIENHLQTCERCNATLHAIRELVRLLETGTADYRQMHLVDISSKAAPKLDVLSSYLNTSDRPLDRMEFGARKNCPLQSLAVPGRPLHYSVGQSRRDPQNFHYLAPLPYLVSPGQISRSRSSFGHIPERPVSKVDEDVFKFTWSQFPDVEPGTAYTQVFRLPAGAQILACDPSPTIAHTGTNATIAWQIDLPPSERFVSSVEYRLQ